MIYRLRIEPSGHEMDIAPTETILEAALRHGYALPYSCRAGTCATCKGKIVSGSVDYGEVDAKMLSDDEIAQGYALFCQATPLGDVTIEAKEVGAAAGIQIKTLPSRVARIVDLAPDVRAIFLQLPSTEEFHYLPGQYIDILLKDGSRRGFSIASTPSPGGQLELHIKRVPGGRFTEHVFSTMKEKDILRFEGPLGTFFVREDPEQRPLLMAATGTGFAPIKGMLQQLFANSDPRPIYFYWGVRYPQDFYYQDLLQEWQHRHSHFHLIQVVSRPDASWKGRCGYITDAILQDFPTIGKFSAYLCGHPDMVFDLSAQLEKAGIDSQDIYADAFVFAKGKSS
ncbi:MAG: CDP-6-deoxy-delta-3,4-glucoseen reductase [Acidithiobacillus sp.]|nr:CDP-6-deoxy-delta-3,4-glucoseen reductase [Acidithiobacillus sp.]